MSRYPSYSVARFDQQFRETEWERNDRLRKQRLKKAAEQKASEPLKEPPP